MTQHFRLATCTDRRGASPARLFNRITGSDASRQWDELRNTISWMIEHKIKYSIECVEEKGHWIECINERCWHFWARIDHAGEAALFRFEFPHYEVTTNAR